MKRLLLRVLGIWTLKTISYAAFFVASLVFFLGSVSALVLSIVHGFILFLLAFLFAEWIFKRANLSVRRLAIVIIVTFVWDAVLFAAFSFWLLGPYRYPTPWAQNLLFFAIHAFAVSLAWYARKRFSPASGFAEGLEA